MNHQDFKRRFLGKNSVIILFSLFILLILALCIRSKFSQHQSSTPRVTEWKHYLNYEQGFEVDYPADMPASFDEVIYFGKDYTVDESGLPLTSTFLTVASSVHDPKYDLDDRIERGSGGNTIFLKKIKIDGYEAGLFEFRLENTELNSVLNTYSVIIVNPNGKDFFLWHIPKDQLQKIIDTFKIIKWKRYKNNEAKYELDYPENVTVTVDAQDSRIVRFGQLFEVFTDGAGSVPGELFKQTHPSLQKIKVGSYNVNLFLSQNTDSTIKGLSAIFSVNDQAYSIGFHSYASLYKRIIESFKVIK